MVLGPACSARREQPTTQPTTVPAEPLSILHFPPDQDRVVIPLTMGNGFFVTKDVTINGRSFDGWWLIDTGAFFSAVDEQIAREMMLPIVEDDIPWLDGVKLDFFRIDSLTVGPVEFTEHAIFSLDLKALGQGIRLDLAGILGSDIWGGMPFCVDYQQHTLELFNPNTFEPPSTCKKYPIVFDRSDRGENRYLLANPFIGHAAIEGSVNADLSCKMLIDTGLNTPIVHHENFIDLHPTLLDESHPESLGLFGLPNKTDIRRTLTESVTVFEQTVATPKGGLAQLDHESPETQQATIGGPVIRNFRLTFDYAHETVWVEWKPFPTVRQQLATGLDPNARSISGSTPLHRAATDGDADAFDALLAAGARTWTPDARGLALLHLAADGGNPEIVARALTDRPADIHARTRGEATPLMLAARKAPTEVIEMFIEAGADVNARNARGGAVIHHAIPFYNQAALEVLIQVGADINVRTKKGIAPLALSAATGNFPAFKRLEDAGARADSMPDGLTLLHAAAQGDNIELFEYIRQSRNIDISVLADNGATPLHTAARTGAIDAARHLLDAGADPTIETRSGMTPLLLAAEAGHTEIVELLISAGADVNAVGYGDSQTALSRAILFGHHKTAIALLEAGADATIANDSGNTPLHAAAYRGHHGIHKALLKEDVDIDAQGEPDNKTALMLAAETGHERNVMLLLQAEADPTLRTKRGATILWHGVYGGNIWVLKRLLEYDIDINAQFDSNQITVLMLAAHKGQPEIVHALLEAGADPTLEDTDRKRAWNHSSGPGRWEIRDMLEASEKSFIPQTHPTQPTTQPTSSPPDR